MIKIAEICNLVSLHYPTDILHMNGRLWVLMRIPIPTIYQQFEFSNLSDDIAGSIAELFRATDVLALIT
jgi:hypothetical protein